MICSAESRALTRIMACADFVVDLRGRGRFKPQSPRCRDVPVVVMAWWVGKLWVAVSDLMAPSLVWGGVGSGVGSENIRDVRRSAPPGDTLLAVAAISTVGGCC